MTDRSLIVLTCVCALGCGLNAGVFFAFSSFVMKALARLAPPQGIAAMNSINVGAVTPVFMTALFGTGAACLLLLITTLLSGQEPAGGYLFVGALVYLVGTIMVTIVFNVPLNNALAAVDASSDEGARVWADFVSGWTMWNHVRAIAALIAAALLTVGLLVWRSTPVA